ncbi:MAG: hypothetical protein BWX70_02375 [Verrucomicrobia bacterium ADurb.Bin070]|nr:MAG: hypothetical protein BWX70_02375 [Verrucomicrobia bacterium ADurb.Bin070]
MTNLARTLAPAACGQTQAGGGASVLTSRREWRRAVDGRLSPVDYLTAAASLSTAARNAAPRSAQAGGAISRSGLA